MPAWFRAVVARSSLSRTRSTARSILSQETSPRTTGRPGVMIESLGSRASVGLLRRADTSAGRDLRSLGQQTALDRGQGLKDHRGPAIVTHQPDTPRLGLELAE